MMETQQKRITAALFCKEYSHREKSQSHSY
uniref:Uncharacterized protein n=1 Tax=Rhizophora mucronata TaxID=61149 RepID=A0A2P2MYF9_RHIMU